MVHEYFQNRIESREPRTMYRYDRLNGAAMTEAIFEFEWGCKDDGKAGVVGVMEVDLKWLDWRMGIWPCLPKPPIRLWPFTFLQLNSTQCRLVACASPNLWLDLLTTMLGGIYS